MHVSSRAGVCYKVFFWLAVSCIDVEGRDGDEMQQAAMRQTFNVRKSKVEEKKVDVDG